jgi:DUF4097 and DUF4098 domain-containing protein YvlB
MKITLALLVTLAILGAATVPVRADEYSYHRTLDTELAVGTARALTVTGYNGDIRLIADAGNTVRVHAVLGARSVEGVNALNVLVARGGSAVSVQNVCPSQRHFFFWTFADCNIQLVVHYPRSLEVTLQNQNGDIDVQGASAAVSITNGNGDITITDAATNVSATQSNGDITTRLAKSWRGSAITLHTNQGDVELWVPREFAANYTTRVLLGSIHNRAPRRSGSASVTATVRFGDVDIRQE